MTISISTATEAEFTTGTDDTIAVSPASVPAAVRNTEEAFTTVLKTKLDGIETGASIPSVVSRHGAVGDGVTNNDTAFGNANTAGGLNYIPKPATSYEFASAFTTTNCAWFIDPTARWDEIFDGGDFDGFRGFRGDGNDPNGYTGSNNWRFGDRAFFGHAAYHWGAENGASPDIGDSWAKDKSTTGGHFLAANATVLSMTEPRSDNGGSYAIVGMADADNSNTPYGQAAIGVGAFTRSNTTTGAAAHGIYTEVQLDYGFTGIGIGHEINMRNSIGHEVDVNPYSFPAKSVVGLWAVTQNTPLYGPDTTNHSSAAIVIGSSQPAGATTDFRWKHGIVFKSKFGDGSDNDTAATTYSDAISMPRMTRIAWWDSQVGSHALAGHIGSKITSDALGMAIDLVDNAIDFKTGPNNTVPDKQAFRVIQGGSSANYLSVQSKSIGVDPVLAANGDANLSVQVEGNGTGGVKLADGASAIKLQVDTTGIGFNASTPIAAPVYGAPTGTATRTAFATGSVTISELAERVKAVIDDLRSYGLAA